MLEQPYTYYQHKLIETYQKVEDAEMDARIASHATERVKTNIDFFFAKNRSIAEWNKTALIKIDDHKQRSVNGVIEPVFSPLDYYCHVKSESDFHKWRSRHNYVVQNF